jgi:hypothetical protein
MAEPEQPVMVKLVAEDRLALVELLRRAAQ